MPIVFCRGQFSFFLSLPVCVLSVLGHWLTQPSTAQEHFRILRLPGVSVTSSEDSLGVRGRPTLTCFVHSIIRADLFLADNGRANSESSLGRPEGIVQRLWQPVENSLLSSKALNLLRFGQPLHLWKYSGPLLPFVDQTSVGCKWWSLKCCCTVPCQCEARLFFTIYTMKPTHIRTCRNLINFLRKLGLRISPLNTLGW